MNNSETAPTRSMIKEIKSNYNDLIGHLSPVKESFIRLTKYSDCICNKYNKIPEVMTEVKQEFILPMGNENTRLMVLGFSSLATVLVMRRYSPVGPLASTRNMVFAYLGLGLFLTPEIYNPIINRYVVNK